MSVGADITIQVENLSKIYHLYNSPRDRFKEALNPRRKKYHHDFYALNDVSFEVGKGETVGIIGRNGSGKSTLLKILTGVLTPSSGNYIVRGKVSSLLELGTGFNPELTGVENVYFNGAILGFEKKEMEQKLDDILSFADIGEFVNQPVKSYSSGMFVRLAFAVAVSVDPDILIIDEALSVGDSYFQVKSMNRMKSFMDNGKTVLFVSHDASAIKTLCQRGVLLDRGRVIKISDASSVIDYYNNLILKDLHKADTDIFNDVYQSDNNLCVLDDSVSQIENEKINFGENSINTGEVDLLSLKVVDSRNQIVESVISEDDIRVIWRVKALKDIDLPHYGIIISDRLGNSAFETNTYCMKFEMEPLLKNSISTIEFGFNFNLIPGTYSISLGVASKGYDKGTFEEYIMLARNIKIIKVIENPNSIIYSGYYNMRPNVKVLINS